MRRFRTVPFLLATLAMGCSKTDTPPSITPYFVDPADDLHVQGGLVRFAIGYGATTSDIGRFELVADGAVVDEIVLPALVLTWDAGSAPEGSHEFVVRAWSGDAHWDSAPVHVIVDRTPPVVTEAGPVVNHRADWPIWIVASEPIIVEPGDVTVTRDGGVPVDVGVVTWPPGRAATAYPIQPWEAPSTLTLRVDGATDLAGNPLPPAERTIEVPFWRQPDPSIAFGTGLINSAGQEPSIGFEGDWLVFSWEDYWERCDGDGTCQSQTVLFGTRRLASAGGQLLAASFRDGSSWPVSAWELSEQALFTQLAAPFPSGGYKHGLAAGARAMPEGRHDLLVTWYVASNPVTTIDVYAARLTDGTWSNLGHVAGGTAWAWSHAAALAPDGTAWVAVTESVESGGSGVGVYRWNGAAWTLMGPIRKAYSFSPSLAVAADGSPYVAYGDDAGDVVVERWDGSAWTSLGAAEPDTSEHAGKPSLALDADGNPIVALCSHAEGLEGEQRLWVRRWTGAAWETLGTALNVSDPVRAADAPSLAIGESGEIAVAFLEWTGEGELTSTPPAAPTATWDLRVVKLNR